ncbi:MAG: hypothetical protein Fur0028_14860 [Bacteroidales bacterium]
MLLIERNVGVNKLKNNVSTTEGNNIPNTSPNSLLILINAKVVRKRLKYDMSTPAWGLIEIWDKHLGKIEHRMAISCSAYIKLTNIPNNPIKITIQ